MRASPGTPCGCVPGSGRASRRFPAPPASAGDGLATPFFLWGTRPGRCVDGALRAPAIRCRPADAGRTRRLGTSRAPFTGSATLWRRKPTDAGRLRATPVFGQRWCGTALGFGPGTVRRLRSSERSASPCRRPGGSLRVPELSETARHRIAVGPGPLSQRTDRLATVGRGEALRPCVFGAFGFARRRAHSANDPAGGCTLVRPPAPMSGRRAPPHACRAHGIGRPGTRGPPAGVNRAHPHPGPLRSAFHACVRGATPAPALGPAAGVAPPPPGEVPA